MKTKFAAHSMTTSLFTPAAHLHLRRLAAGVILACAVVSVPVAAQDNGAALNFVNADMESVIKAVGHYTGMTFIIDPRVKGTLTLVSERQLTKSQAFALLTSQLRLQGFAVVTGDGFAKVVPEAEAKLQSIAYPGWRRRAADRRRPDRHPDFSLELRVGCQSHRRAAPADFSEQFDHGQPGQQQPGDHGLCRQPESPFENHRRAGRTGGCRSGRGAGALRRRQRCRRHGQPPDGAGARRRFRPRVGAGRSAHQLGGGARAIGRARQPRQVADHETRSADRRSGQCPRGVSEKRRRHQAGADAAGGGVVRHLAAANPAGHTGRFGRYRRYWRRRRCGRPAERRATWDRAAAP